MKRGQDIQDVEVEDFVLDRVQQDPTVNSRQVPIEAGVSQWKVLDVLHKKITIPTTLLVFNPWKLQIPSEGLTFQLVITT